MKDFTWYENYPETQKVFLTSFCFVLPKQKGVFFTFVKDLSKASPRYATVLSQNTPLYMLHRTQNNDVYKLYKILFN